MAQVLVAAESRELRLLLCEALRSEGHEAREAADGLAALELAQCHPLDLAICDAQLAKIDGLTLLPKLTALAPQVRTIVLSAHPKIGEARTAFHSGASDYLPTPVDAAAFFAESLAPLLAAVPAHAVEPDSDALVGRCPAMLQLRAHMATLAESRASVLIRGESGTGKEVVARWLHDHSARRARPFVAVNCAALPESLLEAELFGHERGAFTGAVRRRDGRFKAADGGTLLLDEIGELPATVQVKLLRVLEDGSVEPLGADRPLPVDVRVLAATHRDIEQLVREGRFREDLYYRLNVLDLAIPPLRDRPGDLPLLVEHFLRQATPDHQPPPQIAPRAWQLIAAHPFPGNVRELKHAIERSVVLSHGGLIDVDCLPPAIAAHAPLDGAPFETLAETLRRCEREQLLRALALAGGHKLRAAELLGISRKTLWEKLHAHHLSDGNGALHDGT
jgi:DNA-binding NtrC family response regulator